MPQTTVGTVTANDGFRLTVNTLLKRPTVIKERILQMADQQFITDQVLRKVQDIPSGVVLYNESTPLYANGGPSVVAEGGEIPLITANLGIGKAARSVKRAFGIEFTEEMRRRNDMDRVNTSITQVVNSMKNAWEQAFLAQAIAGLGTLAAGTAWATSTTVRRNLANAMLAIQLADADSANQTGVAKFGFQPDTIVMHHARAMDLALNDDMNKYFVGSGAPNSSYADKLTLPGLLFGQFKIVKSWQVPSNQAILLESGTIGGIADERALDVTPLEYNSARETWRCNVVRQSAIFLDQPKAGIVITGI
jgi:hypothetical protein